MDLFTRCSHCNTAFRVTTRDLQASSGRVRCGHCHKVFDGFASLTAQPPADADEAAGVENVKVHEPPAPAQHDMVGKPVQRSEFSPAAITSSPEVMRKARPPATASPVQVASRRDDPAASLYEWEFKLAPAPRRTALWATFSLVLAVVASVQAAYAFRNEIMVTYPQTVFGYERACMWLGCTLGLPRLADRLHIEVSDLQLVDPGRPHEVELSALIRNRASVPIEYPSLELTLTNAAEQVVARRVFLAREYLSDSQAIEKGLRGGGELTIRLFLDTGSVRASGYRLYLFYPS